MVEVQNPDVYPERSEEEDRSPRHGVSSGGKTLRVAGFEVVFSGLKPWRMVSLRSLRSGREWLWSNPILREKEAQYGEPYGSMHDTGGWDEIFPSVAGCTIRREDCDPVQIPDHGDLVTVPWRVEELPEGGQQADAVGECATYFFHRKISVVGEHLRFDYAVGNPGCRAFPWLWCPHPLFRVVPGMSIRLDDGEGQCLADFEVPDPTLPGFEASAVKWFSCRGAVGAVRLLDPEKCEQVMLRFDPREIPYVGLWMNFGGWCGVGDVPYFNLGIEPTTAPHDSLAEAVADGTARWLEAGARVQWSLELMLGPVPENGESAVPGGQTP